MRRKKKKTEKGTEEKKTEKKRNRTPEENGPYTRYHRLSARDTCTVACGRVSATSRVLAVSGGWWLFRTCNWELGHLQFGTTSYIKLFTTSDVMLFTDLLLLNPRVIII